METQIAPLANFRKKNQIKHILGRIKRLQTNCRVEESYSTYEKNRNSFDDF
jgi:hypothetical protein